MPHTRARSRAWRHSTSDRRRAGAMGRRRKASDAPPHPHPHPHASARERNLALALALVLALAFTLVRARPAAVARARRAVADGMSLAASALSSSSSSLESTPIQVACVGDSITCALRRRVKGCAPAPPAGDGLAAKVRARPHPHACARRAGRVHRHLLQRLLLVRIGADACAADGVLGG